MYRTFIKPWLSLLPLETARRQLLSMTKGISRIPLGKQALRLFHRYSCQGLERDVFGLHFSHPIGLGAGFDTNGDYAEYLSHFGFSFIEIGSITPLPEPGNPRPRVYKVPKDNAFIHRIGSANKGVNYAISSIAKAHPDCPIGASLTYNLSSTRDVLIIKDFEKSFSLMYDFVDYFTINLSSPNGNDVLTIQDSSTVADILDPLIELRMCYETYKPILVKVSVDIPLQCVDEIIDYCRLAGVDGIIAGNSPKITGNLSISESKVNKIGSGFISGAPVFEQSLALVRHISTYTQGRFPIVASGGIMTPQQAAEMLDAGASLIQLFSGIAYRGPKLVRQTLKYLDERSKQPSSI